MLRLLEQGDEKAEYVSFRRKIDFMICLTNFPFHNLYGLKSELDVNRMFLLVVPSEIFIPKQYILKC